MLDRLTRYLLISLVCTYLSGCAFISPTADELARNIDLWLADNQYDRILNALDALDSGNPEYAQLLQRKPVFEEKKANYIESISQQAQTLIKNNQWQKAIDLYDQSLDKIDNHPRLLRERKQLIADRQQKVTELRKELLMQHANALISYQKIYSKLHQLIPEDYSAQFDISRYEDDKKEVAEQLEKCAEQARVNKQYELARECYSLSYKLNPSERKLIRLNKLNAQLTSAINRKRYTELLAAYKTAYEKKQYNTARKQLQSLLQLNPEHKQAIQLLDDLNTEIQLKVKDRISAGKYLYSQNKINEALDEWKLAQKLDPENTEIIQLIYRAEKVSKKIKSLEHSQ